MPEEKRGNKERVQEIVDGIEDKIQELFQSDRFLDYLKTMAKFHNYSRSNTILIHAQMPNATQVAGFRQWQTKFGRHVKRGEKGITILAPMPYKKKIEEIKLDPDTKAPMLDKDGNAIIEETMVDIPTFRPVKVFDYSQTVGKPLPQLAVALTGDVEQYDVFVEALRRTSPVPIKMMELPGNMDGYYHLKSKEIVIREGMSQIQTICAMIHEITHSILHSREAEQKLDKPKTDETREIEAESCAYAVSSYYGIDTTANSIGYLALWSSDKDLSELKASLDTISHTVNGLISGIDKHFAEICSERGIDLTPKDTPEELANDLYDAFDGKIELPDLGRDEITNWFVRCLKTGDYEVFKRIDTDNILPAQLADRLELMREHWFSSLTYTLEQVFPGSEIDKYYISATYDADGETHNYDTVFGGTKKQCERVLSGLRQGKISLAEAKSITPEEETELDTYPLPDSIPAGELNEMGYLKGDLLPVSQERAAQLVNESFSVYAVYGIGADLLQDVQEIMDYQGPVIFAISKDEWEWSDSFHRRLAERLEHQEERESNFFNHQGDCYAIYQLKNDESLVYHRFTNFEHLQKEGLSVEKKNYDLIYTAPLSDADNLDTLYERFNIDRPADFAGHSLSVSDIVAEKRGGVVKYHYVDSIGFKELPDFGKDRRKTLREQLQEKPAVEDRKPNKRKRSFER